MLIKRIKALRILPPVEQDVSHLNFYIRKAAKKKFNSSERYPTNVTLSAEIKLLRQWLASDLGVRW